jgi:hypothetical protein
MGIPYVLVGITPFPSDLVRRLQESKVKTTEFIVISDVS